MLNAYSFRQAVLTCGLAAAGLSLIAGTPAQAAPRAHPRRGVVPADSFLHARVYSVDALIHQVQTDPAVRKRYARHFQIPESRVVSYMRANLVESYVPKAGRYTVYCFGRGGKYYALQQTFPRGTKVFALRNGQPVLKWLCGNPLSKFLPSVETRTIIKKVPVVKTTVVTEVSPDIQELTPADTADVLVPTDLAGGGGGGGGFAPVVTLVGASPLQLLGGGGGGSLLPFLLPLGLLGLHGGGGGTPAAVTPAAVPEVSSAAYLLLTAPALMLAGVRFRRRRESVA